MKRTLAVMVASAISMTSIAEEDDARPFTYEFDSSGAPELDGWMRERMAPAIREWYPKLVEMFPSDGWRPYTNLTFRFCEEDDNPAYACGPKVTFSRKWIAENPDDVGCGIHELFHVVQGSYRGAPGWLTEGLADYVRFYLYEPGSDGCGYVGRRLEASRYNDSYRTSAHFLNFVETRYPGTVRELNALCRQRKYDEATYWMARTGKTVEDLEDDWKGRRPAAQAPALRVLDWNVRYSAGDRKSKDRCWPARRDFFARCVARENPDLMAFQEVLPDQREWLESRFHGYAFVGVGRGADGGGEASPVAFRKDRFEAVTNGTFWLSETPDVPGSKSWNSAFPRVCSYAVLRDKATGLTFSFANTHTDHRSEEAREKGMLLIVERMKEFGKGAPVIFTGDHNCLEYEKPAMSVAKLLKDSLYLSETPPEGTWRTFSYWNYKERDQTIAEALAKPVLERNIPGDQSDSKRIDYVYVSPGTKVLDYRTVAAPIPGTRKFPSDHFPIVTTIVLPSPSETFRSVSPNGLNELRLEVGSDGMKYSVLRRGKAVVEPIDISLRVDGHGLLNGAGATPKASSRTLEGKLATPIYKKSEVSLAANETRVDFGDWSVVLLARNDGVAWRFETGFPGEATVTAENTNVRFPKDAQLFYGQVGGFATSFETPVKTGPVSSVKPGHPQIVITPLTAVVPDVGVVGLTESNLLDYPGLNFYRKDGEDSVLRSWQAGAPSQTERKGRWIRVKDRRPYLAKTSGTRVYPWRVFVLGDTPSDLVSADIVYALAEPSRVADTSWIKTGLVQWDWWHGFKITDVPGLKSGCNYETYKAYIDFASANKIPYIIMDEGWSEHLNLDRPREAANVQGVVEYGREKGVGVILWAAWSMLAEPEDRARVFDRYSAMGAKGFKIDFMDRDDQQLERFLEATAADAAARKLVVMYHGIHKPTGLQRTYPNILNYEGVYGLEQGHSAGGQQKIPPNDCAIPYTRGLAGVMDYTPGAMRNRAFDAPAFVKGRDPSACYGTRCHQLALFPLFEAPVQMLCDSPTQYRTAPECAAFITSVPTVWDDTVGVAGEIGKFAAVARRKGREWWLGAITDWQARELTLPTDFLGAGEWDMEAFVDAPDADVNAEHYVRQTMIRLKAGEPLKARLAPGGGFAARFTPCTNL